MALSSTDREHCPQPSTQTKWRWIPQNVGLHNGLFHRVYPTVHAAKTGISEDVTCRITPGEADAGWVKAIGGGDRINDGLSTCVMSERSGGWVE
jgi:hypothetical protein